MTMPRTTIGGPGRSLEVSRIALGAMNFGTRTDEATSYAILDRYAEAGGSFVDTSNNYAFWNTGSQGGESETVLGRWLTSSGMSDRISVATKMGGRPITPAHSFDETEVEQQTPQRIRQALAESLGRLGRDRVEVYYSHVPDDRVPLADQVAGFGALVTDGMVGVVGASNHWSWSLERARRLAREQQVAGWDVLQYSYSYFRGRTDLPDLFATEGAQGAADGNLLSYLGQEPELTLVAYSPLLAGAYSRPERPLSTHHNHPGTTGRRAVLTAVADEVGATANQIVLAWLLRRPVPVIPLVGASSVAQLEETLGAVDVELDDDQLARLDAAGR